MEHDDMDIAAAMGFSSFGGTKKRKLDDANSSRPKPKVDASGANSTKLGVRTKKMTAAEERDADNAHTASHSHPELGPRQNSPSDPALDAPLDHRQTLPDQLLGTEQTASAPLQAVSTSETLSFGGPPISTAELNALRFGVKSENGDVAYFLPNFVEDPWQNFRQV